MKTPETPADEFERQAAVDRTGLLDTLPEQDFDGITDLMAYISSAPISLISLLDRDRNFLKSHHGVPFDESPRNISFCGHAINEEEPIMVVEDAREDSRFHDNPLVSEFNALFYAGVPLQSPDGYKLGTLCIFDTKPRSIDEATRNAMLALAKQVENLFELRVQAQNLANSRRALFNAHRKLWDNHNELSDFSKILAHDIKSPVSSIAFLGGVLKDELPQNTSGETFEVVEKLTSSSLALCQYIDDLLTNRLNSASASKEPIDFSDFFGEINALAALPTNARLIIPDIDVLLEVDRMSLTQIVLNLITNAVKYNQSEIIVIEVTYSEQAGSHVFEVIDNGVGISDIDLGKVFEKSQATGQIDRFGNTGTGIGLSTIKAIVESQGGQISCTSVVGEGSVFTFNLPL